MIYIDTSSLLKLEIFDRHSAAIVHAVAQEPLIVVSSLTNLEAQVQLRGFFLGGTLSAAQMQRAREKISRVISLAPFSLRTLPAGTFTTALEQHEKTDLQCRSLDRLHLAAMAELGIRRLMTHDLRQSAAAAELGYEVVSPGL